MISGKRPSQQLVPAADFKKIAFNSISFYKNHGLIFRYFFWPTMKTFRSGSFGAIF
jgi:hypothetical protein